jgi:hypothetical protein
MPLEKYEPRRICVQYSDTHEMMRHLERAPVQWPRQSSRGPGHGYSWDLGADYDKAVRLLHDGWEQGVKQISALAQPVPNAGRWIEKPDYAGERPDIGRYLAGDPRSMIRRGAARKPKPFMTIVVSIGANCNVEAKSMWNYGAALVALIDRLESKGVRVEVYALWATTTRTARTCISVCLKQTQDVLDINTLAFALAHPAMLRRLMFAALERTRQPYDSGYGASQSLIYEDDMVAPVPGALYVGGVGSSGGACYTLSDALAYAKGQINRAAGDAIAELEEEA